MVSSMMEIKVLAQRLVGTACGLMVMLGCSHAPVQQPMEVAGTGTSAARGQMAEDIRTTPRLVIPRRPSTYDNAVAQANPPTSLGGVATAATAQPSDLRRLQQLAAAHFAAMQTYVARVHRREQVNGKDGPEEWLAFQWRRQPWSVHMKWIGSEHQGREVIYVRGQHGDLLHSLLASGDIPLMPAGKHMALRLDNVFVRSASRHAITEAGIGNLVWQFTVAVDSYEKGERRFGSVRYLGKVRRPEFADPMDAVEQLIPANVEPSTPEGGRRWWLFDATAHLPLLVITLDQKGHEAEYYCYDRIQENAALGDNDFNPASWDHASGGR